MEARVLTAPIEGFDDTGSWARAPGGEVLKRDAPEAIAIARTRAGRFWIDTGVTIQLAELVP